MLISVGACRTEAAPEPARPEPKPTTAASVSASAAVESSPKVAKAGRLVLGAPIVEGAGQSATLAAVAKAPASFADKKLVLEGKVTAVCQHKGCWMELRDEAGEAHVKMAGHSFFVPRTASGKKARVFGKLAGAQAGAACGDGHSEHQGAGCKAEAEQQLGRPLAKLELEAEGVEILD